KFIFQCDSEISNGECTIDGCGIDEVTPITFLFITLKLFNRNCKFVYLFT
ncbi:hypothetical protein Bhyg_18019, partial [Pseudolycoriella hygida]